MSMTSVGKTYLLSSHNKRLKSFNFDVGRAVLNCILIFFNEAIYSGSAIAVVVILFKQNKDIDLCNLNLSIHVKHKLYISKRSTYHSQTVFFSNIKIGVLTVTSHS